MRADSSPQDQRNDALVLGALGRSEDPLEFGVGVRPLSRHLCGQFLEAYERAAAEKPDLVLMDIMMPEYDGFNGMSRMRENDETKDIPVLMVTAKEDSKAVMTALQHGAVGYIIKPLVIEDVLSRVRNILASHTT